MLIFLTSTTGLSSDEVLESVLELVELERIRARDAPTRTSRLVTTELEMKRLLKMAESGYQYGVKAKLEVDDAQLNYLQARVNLARARRDYLTAWTRLHWTVGEDLQTALAIPAWAAWASRMCPLLRFTLVSGFGVRPDWPISTRRWKETMQPRRELSGGPRPESEGNRSLPGLERPSGRPRRPSSAVN